MYIEQPFIFPRAGEPDPFISNGTCYFKAGQKTSGSFIPCGNAALGHQTCCAAKDSCLSDNACQSQQFNTNYLAGCTDPTYRHSSCPDKFEEEDLPWAPIVLCSKADGVWQTCPQAGKPMEMALPETPCACIGDPKTMVLRHPGQSTLEYLAVLPSETGSVIRYQSGHSPTIASTAVKETTTVYAPSPTGNSGSSPVATSPSTDSTTSTPDSGLSRAAKAAIGGSIGGVALLALATMAFFLRRRRRNRQLQQNHHEQEQEQTRQRHNRIPSGFELPGDEPPRDRADCDELPGDLPARRADGQVEKELLPDSGKQLHEPDRQLKVNIQPDEQFVPKSPATAPPTRPNLTSRVSFGSLAAAARLVRQRLSFSPPPTTTPPTPPAKSPQPKHPPRGSSIAHPVAAELESHVPIELESRPVSIRTNPGHTRPLSIASIGSQRSEARSEAGSVRSLWRPSSVVPPMPTGAAAAVFAASAAARSERLEEEVEMTGMTWDGRPIVPPKNSKPLYEMPT